MTNGVADHASASECVISRVVTYQLVPRASWRKSRRSATNGNCVEVALAGPAVAMRDSKSPDAAVLAFDRRSWSEFVAELKMGIYDVARKR